MEQKSVDLIAPGRGLGTSRTCAVVSRNQEGPGLSTRPRLFTVQPGGELPTVTCARGELNRKTTTLDHARTTVLSVKLGSRCLRLPPVTPGACTPGVHQPVFSASHIESGTVTLAQTHVDDARTRLLEGEVIDDARLFQTRLQEWEDYYNYDRPHGALGGQTPYERLRQKAEDPLP